MSEILNKALEKFPVRLKHYLKKRKIYDSLELIVESFLKKQKESISEQDWHVFKEALKTAVFEGEYIDKDKYLKEFKQMVSNVKFLKSINIIDEEREEKINKKTLKIIAVAKLLEDFINRLYKITKEKVDG